MILSEEKEPAVALVDGDGGDELEGDDDEDDDDRSGGDEE